MKTIKLQENESLIDSFELEICTMNDELKTILERGQFLAILWESPWLTEWHHINLYFTSKRIEMNSRGEQISISYKDIKNISISNLRCRPPRTWLYILLYLLIGLAVIGISVFNGKDVTTFQWIIFGIVEGIWFYNLIFRWVMTYNIYLGDQIEFSIRKNDEIIEKIKDAYEKGKHYNINNEVN